MARSIFSRKLDMLYLVFFVIHLPVMFCVDLAPLYPESIKPAFMTDLRAWYIHTYRDQFFTQPPAWFNLYMWMELLYHVPLSVWAIGALLRGRPMLTLVHADLMLTRKTEDSKTPIHLLVWAVQTAVTTSTCIADYLSWPSYTNSEKLELGKLYVPYLALSIFMGIDMFARLDRRLSNRANGQKKAA